MADDITAGVPAGLLAAHDHARDELRRADIKATALLSVVGAALAGVIALTGRPMPTPALVALWVAAVPILVGVLTLLAVIRPRIMASPAAGSWLYAAGRGPASVLDSYATADGQASGIQAAQDLTVLAGIGRRKFRLISHAVALLVIGLALVSVALVLSVVAR